MAFSTIQGSGGAPDSFVGTSGVDVISLIDSTGNFFLGAQEANDVVSFVSANINDAGVITGATLKGGQGSDTFRTTAGMAVFNGVFLNGNSDADTISFVNGSLSASTVQGGQGADNITVGGAGAIGSLINGNKDNDTITLQTTASANSSVYGGQGNDSINVNIGITSSVVNGDAGNDNITSTGDNSMSGTAFGGGDGNDTINLASVTTAGNGAVSITGDAGNDQLTGTAGGDTIDGGTGNDTVTGGGGADSLTGGGGADGFGYGTVAAIATQTGVTTATADVITDWTTVTDRIIIDVAGTAANFDNTDATAYANLAAAVAVNLLAGDTYKVVAVGTAAAGFTSYLLVDTAGGGTAAEGAIQLGGTAAYGTVAQALASIVATDIVVA